MINFPDWSCKVIEYYEHIFEGTDFISCDRSVIQYGINKKRFLEYQHLNGALVALGRCFSGRCGGAGGKSELVVWRGPRLLPLVNYGEWGVPIGKPFLPIHNCLSCSITPPHMRDLKLQVRL